jgi:flavin-dependent dehydrogenase
MSVGVVMSQKDAAELGASSAERLDAAIRRDPVLSQESKDLKRVSEVRTYGNYQLIAHRGSGENWAAVGDAFGFVDPMLSPGMMVAMDSALQLCKELERFPIREALERYSKRVTDELSSWMDLISYFYNGRIFELHDAGKAFQNQYHYLPLGFMESFMSKNMAGMASGFTTSSPFSRGVLKNMDRWVLGGSATDQKYAII